MRTRCPCWLRVTWRIIYESDEQSSKGKDPISPQPNIPMPWSINSGVGHSEPSRSPWETMKEDWWGKPVSSSQCEGSTPSVSGRNFANPTPVCSVARSCPTLWNPCSPSVCGISQTRTLERVAVSSSRASSWPWDWIRDTCVSCIAGGFFTHWIGRSGFLVGYSSRVAKSRTQLPDCMHTKKLGKFTVTSKGPSPLGMTLLENKFIRENQKSTTLWTLELSAQTSLCVLS